METAGGSSQEKRREWARASSYIIALVNLPQRFLSMLHIARFPFDFFSALLLFDLFLTSCPSRCVRYDLLILPTVDGVSCVSECDGR